MRININIKSGVVSIESDTALAVKQDNRDREHAAVENLMGALIATIGSECDGCSEGSDTSVGEFGSAGQDTPLPEVTPVPEVREATATDVVRALKEMYEAKPQWGARSAEAIAKHLGADVLGVDAAIQAAYDNDDVCLRVRRSGQVVYSVN